MLFVSLLISLLSWLLYENFMITFALFTKNQYKHFVWKLMIIVQ